jgi:hypothetical protein
MDADFAPMTTCAVCGCAYLTERCPRCARMISEAGTLAIRRPGDRRGPSSAWRCSTCHALGHTSRSIRCPKRVAVITQPGDPGPARISVEDLMRELEIFKARIETYLVWLRSVRLEADGFGSFGRPR